MPPPKKKEEEKRRRGSPKPRVYVKQETTNVDGAPMQTHSNKNMTNLVLKNVRNIFLTLTSKIVDVKLELLEPPVSDKPHVVGQNDIYMNK